MYVIEHKSRPGHRLVFVEEREWGPNGVQKRVWLCNLLSALIFDSRVEAKNWMIEHKLTPDNFNIIST